MVYAVYFEEEERDYGCYLSVILAKVDEDYDYDIVSSKLIFKKYFSFKEREDKTIINNFLESALKRIGSRIVNGTSAYLPEYEIVIYEITEPKYRIV